MTKVTVHPDALIAANAALRFSSTGLRAAVEAAIQWYSDHPQITTKQVQLLRNKYAFGMADNDGFAKEFLQISLSGKPEVPQELRDLVALRATHSHTNWDTLSNGERETLLAVYNLGKGAK